VSNFLKRAITGTVFVIVMVGGIWWNYWSLCTLFFLISMLGLNEFYGLVEKSSCQPQRWTGLVVGALIFIIVALKDRFLGGSLLIFSPCVLLIAFIFFIELYRNHPNPFANIALTVIGIIYIVLPFAMWVSYLSPFLPGSNLVNDNPLLKLIGDALTPKYNPHVLLGFFFIVWTNDTGAYLSGMTMGKHKLWERISPKKTWEGFFGGVILSIGIAFLISHYYTELSPIVWMLVGLTIGIFGTLGDLVKSLLKRSIDVKDSGTLLPGHGGILDRFDAVLLATPMVLVLLQLSEMFSRYQM
jgi:phosphatidate cytidylyltransferase